MSGAADGKGGEAAPGAKGVCVELRERPSFDWPLVSAAARRDGTVRPALGGVAPRPWAVADMGAARILKTARPLDHNGCKMKLVRVLLERALEAVKQGPAGPLDPQNARILPGFLLVTSQSARICLSMDEMKNESTRWPPWDETFPGSCVAEALRRTASPGNTKGLSL